MDSAPKKFYHIHGIDSRNILETFFSKNKVEMIFGEDCLKFPMINLHYVFSRGFVAGKVLIDISIGSFIHHLFAASEFFEDIIILKFSEKCVMELQRWLNDRTGAFDWTHTSSTAIKLEGKSNKIPDKEMSLKTTIKHIVMCKLEKENITHPLVLPLADCVISAWILDVISKDQDEYVKNLKKISKHLRIGGHLILLGTSKMTYFKIGENKYHVLNYEEEFAKNTLKKLGFIIDYFAVQRRSNASNLVDYKALTFIMAHKEK
ncbi:nicotinamide N-methyltransferase-like [Pyxicephalus adspersus]|uniref:nicotinamide N-methyltransferase-like n=1 Tax=Pyxicephalus adspersus TaxID=30357 RepID=UPI003B5C4C83